MVVDIHLSSDFQTKELERDVREGFAKSCKEIPPKWFYDDKGSDLFEKIMELDQYYLTRREQEILDKRAADIAEVTQATTLVELGSGNSEKTLVLLDALLSLGHLSHFVPFDVSKSALDASMTSVKTAHPEISVHGVVGDFHHHLTEIPHEGKRLIVFLGGTIGNFRPKEREVFLADISASMDSGDYFLLGSDLVKDTQRLLDAYNDSEGITSEFNLNVLRVLNQNLDGNFDLDKFSHRAIYNEEEQWIEMRLKSECEQEVLLKKIGMCLTFLEGEDILTEISSKFSKEGISEELEATGLSVEQQWTDEAGDYLVTLALAP